MKIISLEAKCCVSDGTHIPYYIKFSELQNIKDESIIFMFPKGKFTMRMKKIESLGYSLDHWVHEPDAKSPIYSTYSGVFVR